jgi:hypothetical protein
MCPAFFISCGRLESGLGKKRQVFCSHLKEEYSKCYYPKGEHKFHKGWKVGCALGGCVVLHTENADIQPVNQHPDYNQDIY